MFRVCVCVLEENLRCHILDALSTFFFFQTGSLADLEPTRKAKLAQQALWICLSPYP